MAIRSDIPVGILTRNRAVYLDATIRSLEASTMPDEVPITVYDDSSDDPISRQFLDTAETIEIEHEWPSFQEWTDANLGLTNNKPLRGIFGKIGVVKNDPEPFFTDPQVREAGHLGVVIASCWAIRHMFDAHPDTPAVILLQDDVVFVPDWYSRLVEILDTDPHQGIVAGMHLDHSGKEKGYYTAQCYLITREFFEAERVWFGIPHFNHKSFDVQICARATRAGFTVELLQPYVCQHIGVVSTVRPSRPFKENDWVRMGLNPLQ